MCLRSVKWSCVRSKRVRAQFPSFPPGGGCVAWVHMAETTEKLTEWSPAGRQHVRNPTRRTRADQVLWNPFPGAGGVGCAVHVKTLLKGTVRPDYLPRTGKSTPRFQTIPEI